MDYHESRKELISAAELPEINDRKNALAKWWRSHIFEFGVSHRTSDQAQKSFSLDRLEFETRKSLEGQLIEALATGEALERTTENDFMGRRDILRIAVFKP